MRILTMLVQAVEREMKVGFSLRFYNARVLGFFFFFQLVYFEWRVWLLVNVLSLGSVWFWHIFVCGVVE